MLETLHSFFDPPITADPEQSTAKLAWVVRLRWVAIAAQILSIVPALEFQVLEPKMLPLFGSVVATLAVLNVGTWIGLRRGTRGSPGHLFVQLGADILGLSALLILTGGAWNPMVPILLVHSVLGALLLEGRLGLTFFGLLLGYLALIQFNGRNLTRHFRGYRFEDRSELSVGAAPRCDCHRHAVGY